MSNEYRLNPVYKTGLFIANLILINMLWLFTSFLGFGITIGASTTAAYYVCRKMRKEGVLYLNTFKEYFYAFKRDFKDSTIVWVGIALLQSIVLFNMENVSIFGNLSILIHVLQVILFVETVVIMLYLFPLISRFEIGLKYQIQNAFIMSHYHIFTTLTLLVTLLAVVWITIKLGYITIIITVGLFIYWSNLLLEVIFKRYIDKKEGTDNEI